jgi:hypothetical protein
VELCRFTLYRGGPGQTRVFQTEYSGSAQGSAWRGVGLRGALIGWAVAAAAAADWLGGYRNGLFGVGAASAAAAAAAAAATPFDLAVGSFGSATADLSTASDWEAALAGFVVRSLPGKGGMAGVALPTAAFPTRNLPSFSMP